MKEITLCIYIYCLSFYVAYTHAESTSSEKSVILIMYDDLRPELSSYGKKHMHTPNFERLANRKFPLAARF